MLSNIKSFRQIHGLYWALLFAMIVVFGVMLAGCGSNPSVENTTWTYTSMEPSQNTSESLSEADQASKAEDATMLDVFMNGASVTFSEGGALTYEFLGSEFSGNWAQDGDKVTVTINDEGYTGAAGEYVISGDELIFTAASDSDSRLDGFTVTYAKNANA